MNTKQKLKKTALVKAVRRDDPYLTLGAARVESDKFWRWGDDNLFPTALALMSSAAESQSFDYSVGGIFLPMKRILGICCQSRG